MRKNTTDYNVIKAMTIGITAMLAIAKPMTVQAAEGETVPEGNGEDEVNNVEEKSSEYAAVEEAATEANEAVDAALDSADTVKEDVTEEVVAGEAGTNAEGDDLAQNVLDAADAIENPMTEDGTPLADTESAIENAQVQAEVAKTQDALSDAALNSADSAAQDASETAEELNNAMEEAEQNADAQIEKIEGATTVEEANAAYDELESVVEDAQTDFDAKLQEYNNAKANYEEEAAKVAEYEKAYNEAVANASANAEEAAANLKAAQEKADELEKALEEAKTAIETSEADALDIAADEELTENDNGLNYSNQDKLFESIMRNYYIPEVKGVDDPDGEITITWSRFSDDDLNYCVVEYPDGTKEYYNYKMEDGSKDKLVIFEKREVEVNGDASVNPDQYVDEEENVFTPDEVQDGLEAGTIVEVDGQYVDKNDATDSKTLVTEITAGKGSLEAVNIDENTVNTDYIVGENGDLIGITTADVTRIAYTEGTKESVTYYDTEEKREQALERALKKLEDTIVIDTQRTDQSVHITGEGHAAVKGSFSQTASAVNADSVDAAITNGSDSIEGAVRKQYEEKGYYVFAVDVNNVNAVESGTGSYDVSANVDVTYGLIEEYTYQGYGGGSDLANTLKTKLLSIVGINGGIVFEDTIEVDVDNKTATCKYVAGIGGSGLSPFVEAAKKELEEDMLNQAKGRINKLKNLAAEENQDVKLTGVIADLSTKEEIKENNYNYVITYLEGGGITRDTEIIETETYGDAKTLEGQIIQNLNYLNGEYKLTQDDEAYRDFVDSATNLADKYERLLEEAKKANEDLKAAQEKAEELVAAIEELEARNGNMDKLEVLNAQLADAEADMDAAEETLNGIKDKLVAAEETLDEVVKKLTPDADDGTGESGGNTDDGAGEGGSTDDGAGEGGSTDDGAGEGGSTDDGTGESGGNTDDGAGEGGSTDDGAGEGGSTDDGAGEGGSADNGAGESGGNTDDGAGEGGSADNGAGESGGNTDDGAGEGGSTDDGAGEGGSADNGAGEGGGNTEDESEDDGSDDTEGEGASESENNDEESSDNEEDTTTVPTTFTDLSAVPSVDTSSEDSLNTAANEQAEPEGTVTELEDGNGVDGDGSEGIVTIEEEDTPLSDGQEEAEDDGEEETEPVVKIADEEVPLSGGAGEKKIPWPWWILILILGATGYEMYKKHQQKKEAAKEGSDQ